MRECWVRATKYGVAFFPYRMKMGTKMRMEMISEWVGPRCSKPGISRSMSGKMEAKKRRGMLSSRLRILLEAFPVRYPKAKCPTAYVSFLS